VRPPGGEGYHAPRGRAHGTRSARVMLPSRFRERRRQCRNRPVCHGIETMHSGLCFWVSKSFSPDVKASVVVNWKSFGPFPFPILPISGMQICCPLFPAVTVARCLPARSSRSAGPPAAALPAASAVPSQRCNPDVTPDERQLRFHYAWHVLTRIREVARDETYLQLCWRAWRVSRTPVPAFVSIAFL
jgi:hypothetical protein